MSARVEPAELYDTWWRIPVLLLARVRQRLGRGSHRRRRSCSPGCASCGSTRSPRCWPPACCAARTTSTRASGAGLGNVGDGPGVRLRVAAHRPAVAAGHRARRSSTRWRSSATRWLAGHSAGCSNRGRWPRTFLCERQPAARPGSRPRGAPGAVAGDPPRPELPATCRPGRRTRRLRRRRPPPPHPPPPATTAAPRRQHHLRIGAQPPPWRTNHRRATTPPRRRRAERKPRRKRHWGRSSLLACLLVFVVAVVATGRLDGHRAAPHPRAGRLPRAARQPARAPPGCSSARTAVRA